MRILVYGAGSIGSLYAALLKESGQDVSILARGRRLAEIRRHGLRLEEADSGKKTTSHVPTVERLDPGDRYDVVLVTVGKNNVAEVLPVLSENRQTPSVVFFGNNAAGPGELTAALGRERVLLGFPGAAAAAHDGILRYLILSAREQPTTIGELDGTSSARLEALADALRGAGFSVAVCSDMDAWLKTHAAEIAPTAGALYMAGADLGRLARTRDALLLMLRAIREGHRVLSALGVPITPRIHRIFRWLPEPLLLFVARRMIENDGAQIRVGHALGARDEMRTLAEEFHGLVRASGVSTPSIDILNRHLDLGTEPLAEGSAKLRLHWVAGGTVFGGVLTTLAALLSLLA